MIKNSNNNKKQKKKILSIWLKIVLGFCGLDNLTGFFLFCHKGDLRHVSRVVQIITIFVDFRKTTLFNKA